MPHLPYPCPTCPTLALLSLPLPNLLYSCSVSSTIAQLPLPLLYFPYPCSSCSAFPYPCPTCPALALLPLPLPNLPYSSSTSPYPCPTCSTLALLAFFPTCPYHLPCQQQAKKHAWLLNYYNECLLVLLCLWKHLFIGLVPWFVCTCPCKQVQKKFFRLFTKD